MYLQPELSEALDEAALFEVIAGTIASALGDDVEVDVVRVERALADRFKEQVGQLAQEVGYLDAERAFRELLAGEPGAEADEDQYFEELSQAGQTLASAEAALREALEARGPLVEFEAGRVGIDITTADLYVATPVAGESWALVGAGTAAQLYESDNLRFRQAIANTLVQALGFLAGLDARNGSPTQAMTVRIDFEAEEHLARDTAPVTFTPTERDTVRSVLLTRIEAVS